MIWFDALPLIAKVGLGVLFLPIILVFIGCLIFIMESPGDDFWGYPKPSIWQMTLKTAGIGAIGTLLLCAIFGGSWLLIFLLSRLGFSGAWVPIAAFVGSLISVFGPIIYWFEGRAKK